MTGSGSNHVAHIPSFKAVVHVLLALVVTLWSTVGLAQDTDVHIQIQPRLLAKAQSPASEAGAQQSAPQAPAQSQSSSPGILIIPAGTKLPLALARPLSFHHTKAGDTAYLQTTFPISAQNQMAIPPGTYLQGTIDKVTRRDRTHVVIAFDLRSAEVIFSTGYTVTIPGPLDAFPTSVRLLAPDTPNGNGKPVPVMAAGGGPAPPPLPPLPGSSFPSKALFGAIGVVAAAGLLTTILLIHNSDFYVEPGTPMEIVLQQPLQLDQDRVALAVQQYAQQSAGALPPIPQPPQMATCWTAGDPGTPDTVIPGTPTQTIPGTPPTIIPGDPPTVIPGTPPVTIPGTPETRIPGTPATPPTSYPCRK